MMFLKDHLEIYTPIMFYLMAFIFNKYHIMSSLIICEFVVISIMMVIITVVSSIQMEMYFILMVLIVSITESVIGLSIMVTLIRTHSNDFMKSMNMLKF